MGDFILSQWLIIYRKNKCTECPYYLKVQNNLYPEVVGVYIQRFLKLFISNIRHHHHYSSLFSFIRIFLSAPMSRFSVSGVLCKKTIPFSYICLLFDAFFIRKIFVIEQFSHIRTFGDMGPFNQKTWKRLSDCSYFFPFVLSFFYVLCFQSSIGLPLPHKNI